MDKEDLKGKIVLTFAAQQYGMTVEALCERDGFKPGDIIVSKSEEEDKQLLSFLDDEPEPEAPSAPPDPIALGRLQAGHKSNFDTLMKAADNGDLALMMAKRKADGSDVVLICAVNRETNGDVSFVPLAEMVEGNPYEKYEPPTAEEV